MTTQEQTIKTRICLISDTHTCAPGPPQNLNNAYRHPLPKADILLHAGDITKVGYKAEHEAMVAMLKEADAELKIVIPGNHDITLDEEYYNRIGHLKHRHRRLRTEDDGDEGEGYRENLQEIRALYTDDSAREAGIVYLEEGIRSFTLSTGARFTLYASAYQPEFCQWAFAYERSTDRYNLPPSSSTLLFKPPNPVPDFPAVDIMLTHGPPYGILDGVFPSGDNVGCQHLFKATARARPRLHVFGHIHEGYGATRLDWSKKKFSAIPSDPEEVLEERCAHYDISKEGEDPLRFGEETLFVNASVVTFRYKPINAPWLVDLDLPRSG